MPDGKRERDLGKEIYKKTFNELFPVLKPYRQGSKEYIGDVEI